MTLFEAISILEGEYDLPHHFLQGYQVALRDRISWHDTIQSVMNDYEALGRLYFCCTRLDEDGMEPREKQALEVLSYAVVMERGMGK